MNRFYETFIVLVLLAFVVLGLTYVVSSLIDKERSGFQTFLSEFLDVLFMFAEVFSVFYRSVELLFAIFVLVYVISWSTHVAR